MTGPPEFSSTFTVFSSTVMFGKSNKGELLVEGDNISFDIFLFNLPMLKSI